MGFFSKIGKGFKKLGGFVGKVTKGFASGGLLGGAGAFVSNLGSGKPDKKAQDKAFGSSGGGLAQNVSLSGGGIVIETEKERRNKMLLIGGAVLAFLLGVIYFFTRKKR